MSRNHTLLLMLVAGGVGGVMVALRSQPQNNLPSSQAQISESSSIKTPSQTNPNTSSPLSTPPATVPTTPTPTSLPTTQGCKITQAVVADPDPPLNVRSSPGVTNNNQVTTLNKGTWLSVVGEENGWFKITEPVVGWVSKIRTKSSCSEVTKRIQFPKNGISALVKGKIIGGGNHQYILGAAAGQTMTIEKLNADSVLPTIVSPSGLLAGDSYTDGNRTKWVGQLPFSGDYYLEMNSNFQGFKYNFLVKIR